jgi:hypothetical protein
MCIAMVLLLTFTDLRILHSFQPTARTKMLSQCLKRHLELNDFNRAFFYSRSCAINSQHSFMCRSSITPTSDQLRYIICYWNGKKIELELLVNGIQFVPQVEFSLLYEHINITKKNKYI